MEKNILSAIGNTPLIRLSNWLGDGGRLQVYAKLEMLNPGGSAKDRPALRMIREAWQKGAIGPGSVVIESSSGNMAISLAYICSFLGLTFICVVDPRTAEQNLRILKAFGAQIDYVGEPDPETGEFLQARIRRVKQLLSLIPGSFWPNQYANPDNYMAHYDTTMNEIVAELGRVDYLFGAVSTCGTMRGCAQYARDLGLPIEIVAVDAVGSVLFGGEKGKRRFPGLGAGMVPPLGQVPFADRVAKVSDRDMVAGCRSLVRQESIMAGPSSGAVVMALKKLAPELPDGSVCVVILHDRGERYLDTVFSDEWVQREFGSLIGETEG